MENIIKIPKNIVILYCDKKNIITSIGSVEKKSLKLKVKIKILKKQKLIQVNSIPFSKISNNKKRNILALRTTTVSLIKKLILETSYKFYKKLKLIGVGYKSMDNKNEKSLLSLKLGYSHPIFFKIPDKSKIQTIKQTSILVYGSSYLNVTQTASIIRAYKKPEPYKGKGILYNTEKVKLKEGKKV